MTRLQKFALSLSATLLAGSLGCANDCPRKPDLGPAFVDIKRDLEGTRARLNEFDVVCVQPTKLPKPQPPLAPSWCAWTMQADSVIRANNAKAGELQQVTDGED